MFRKSLAELHQALTTREISSLELTELFLKRIEKYDARLNSFITVTADQARAQAKAADERLAQGEATPLTGIPIAHKDIFCTQGVRTTCASKMLETFVAPYQATAVDKLEQAGAVMLGKLNMDEFAMGSSNENSHFGPVKNPWDETRVPGGSSGGSAAATAARLCAAATGTDTGGSVRQPAALCGVTGIKPTYGRVSRYGMIAYASSLDQAGIFAQNARDVALMLAQIAGFDSKDSTSVEEPVPDYFSDINTPLKSIKIGVPEEFFGDGLDPAIACLIEEAMLVLEKRGARLRKIKLPNQHLAIPTYYVLAAAECSSNLARYDGVRYGHRCVEPKDLKDLYERSRAEGFNAEVQRRIMLGTYALSAGYYDAYYLKAQKIRRLITNDFRTALEKVDLILAPTSPSIAFKLGEKTSDPLSMYLSDIYTIPVNLAGLPALSMPVGFHQNLPVGLQLIGNYFSENQLLNVAHDYQQKTDWHQQIPTDFDA